MSYHINTSSIHVFPLAKNRQEDRSARLFYENNIANLTRQVVDNVGFIITPKSEDLSTGISYKMSTTQPVNGDYVGYDFILKSDFCFNLYGYYFMLEPETTIIQVNFHRQKADLQKIADVYAAIVVNNGEILGQDDSNTGEYSGLHILSSKPENGEYTAFLKLFSIETMIQDSNRLFQFNADDSSYIKLDASSLDITIKRIDGKRAL